MNSPGIEEDDLHAKVDGQLAGARAPAVAAHLAQDAQAAQQVQAWLGQNQAIKALYDPVLDEPLPAHLMQAAQAAPARSAVAANAPAWRHYAAMLLVVAVMAGTGGWWLHGLADQGRLAWWPGAPTRLAQASIPLVRLAAVAHNVYSSDLRRPVEVGADQEQALVTWLSRRIGASVRAPKLAPLGYDLVGGRLLPGQSGPVAQFMYQDAGGQRLTLYVSRDQVQSTGTGFRFAREGKLNVFYWIDGQFGYALSGAIPGNELSRIASSVYEQLESTQ